MGGERTTTLPTALGAAVLVTVMIVSPSALAAETQSALAADTPAAVVVQIAGPDEGSAQAAQEAADARPADDAVSDANGATVLLPVATGEEAGEEPAPLGEPARSELLRAIEQSGPDLSLTEEADVIGNGWTVN